MLESWGEGGTIPVGLSLTRGVPVLSRPGECLTGGLRNVGSGRTVCVCVCVCVCVHVKRKVGDKLMGMCKEIRGNWQKIMYKLNKHTLIHLQATCRVQITQAQDIIVHS